MEKETIEQRIQKIKGNSLKIRDLQGMSQSKVTSKEELIKYALSKNEDLNGHDLEDLAKALLYRNDFHIQIGDKKLSAEELKADVIETLENPINPVANEYWVSEAKDVIVNMNDNDINYDDLSQRKVFLENIDDRTSQLYAMLALYQNNPLPRTRDIIARIKARINMLESIKEATVKATKSPEKAIAEPTNTEQEKTKAKIYLGVLDYINEEKEIPNAMKLKLELNNGVNFDYSLAENAFNLKHNSDKNEIIDRIKQLSGRQQEKSSVKLQASKMRFDKSVYQKWLLQKNEKQI